ncbi:MAG: N-6 DNA methylase [Planctomycetes bacterium]|nr:N-6 DNA methylase [Planctomycetota bacterium]MBL7037506.1 N-6 DNA methylase [Pirellulaceae bacterium]
MNRDLRQFVRDTVQWTNNQRSEVARRLQSNTEGPSLRAIRDWVQSATATTLSDDDFADLYAQTVACSTAVLRLAHDTFRDGGAFDWLLANSNPLWQTIWSDCLSLTAEREMGAAAARAEHPPDQTARLASQVDYASHRHDPIIHFYERFLAQYDSGRRTTHGVFYTPAPIAKYIVQQVDRSLRDEFDLVDGLADLVTWSEYAQRHDELAIPRGADPQSPFVTVLDPAMGTGIFLVEVVSLIHRKLTERWIASGCNANEVNRRWNEYVPSQLLPRIVGLELMLPACAVAQLKLVDKLAETGFTFDAPAKLQVHLANTLVGPAQQLRSFGGHSAAIKRAVSAARDASYAMPFTVVVGNPPFSGISEQQGRWITELLKGRSPEAGDWANYYEVDGRPLGERKHWLQDDYVKFMRYAHWNIESAGCGIIGLVSNHGYLDNPTFRGMRQQLMRTFSRITVVDLHGNRKKKERAPQGGLDQNVFAIEQGTAIGLFSRRPGKGERCKVEHAELWGEADKKLATLSSTAASADSSRERNATTATPLTPRGPDYVFVPRDDALRQEYERGFRLSDTMAVNVTAPVTARDSFVIAFDEEELLDRMEQFRDLSIPDEEIRRRYFTNSRSAKYPPGDTRGWKLPVSRRRMAEDKNWRDYIRPCWYRPFDRRVIYWADWMVDWPRSEVTQHILAGDNMAIVARRQMLPTQPCNYFWITDGLTLDGVIRSDNRGSESVFPVHLYKEKKDGVTHRRANFSEPFVAETSRALGLTWTDDGTGNLRESFGPDDLAYYCYALFFSPTYRERYAEVLRTDFPRVFLPHDLQLFCTLREFGARLADCHLLRTSDVSRPDGYGFTGADSAGRWSLNRGFPKYREGRVFVSDRCWFDGVPEEVWDFHAGGHQVCRKWLKDRRGRMLTSADAAVYRQIVASLAETLRCMREIDEAITHHGGWPRAFK